MRIQTTVSVLLAVLLVAAGGAFVLLDFHAGQSDTVLSSTVAADAINNATTGGDTGIILYAEGDDELARQLVTALGEQGIDATLVSELETQYDQPVLYVSTTSTSYTYNPIFPRGNSSWEYGYAADGNATIARSLVEQDSYVVVVRETPPADADYRYYVHGEMTSTDESSGFYSLPAYRKHLAAGVAEATATSLTEQFHIRAQQLATQTV